MEELRELMDSRMEEIADALREQIEESVGNALAGDWTGMIAGALDAYFASCGFTLPDGTAVRAREHLRVLSPDRKKLLVCCGGLKVDGCTLLVQNRAGGWDALCYWRSPEEAAAALLRIRDAMRAGETDLEL